MASEAKANQPLIVFWCGVAVAEFGAIQPGFGYPWHLSAWAVAGLLVALGLLSVKVPEILRSEQARQRLRLAGYVVGTVLVTHQLSSTAYVTTASRAGSLLLYGIAAVMAVWHHAVRATTRGSLLIVADLEPAGLRDLLATHTGDTVTVYRTDRVTDELRELEAEHGLVVVAGREHDPRAKERLSASGLSRQVPDIAERTVIVAGPRPFQRYVRGALTRLSVPKAQVRTTRFKRRPFV
ncbi:hypothetical protein [Nonomuraea guangzhouensis]|uniref:Uncharacterized protein n=1 Tax=Nonomuraea guangzhouensis TaxID=1291555 RepID=A0ABW4G2Y8_9ACTN|nr:hypothetical protein [Nonomuraea guangzhouensis]